MLKGSMFALRFLAQPKAQPSIEEGYTFIKHKKITYTVHRKPRRRKIALFIEPSGRLHFVAPLRTRTPTIDTFLHRSQDWILGRLSDLHDNPSPHFPSELTEGATVYYLGTPYQITITQNAGAQTCQVDKTRLEINLPKFGALSPSELQEEIRLEIILWYKKQARQILKERSEFWSEQMQLKYRSLKITSPTRQWGSCSARNDIRLNWRVLMAPLPVIDYLIVHELAHILHKNHSARFWNCVAQFVPDYKTRQHVLKPMDAGSIP